MTSYLEDVENPPLHAQNLWMLSLYLEDEDVYRSSTGIKHQKAWIDEEKEGKNISFSSSCGLKLLYNNLDSCGEYSLRTWNKCFFFIPQFTILNAPI